MNLHRARHFWFLGFILSSFIFTNFTAFAAVRRARSQQAVVKDLESSVVRIEVETKDVFGSEIKPEGRSGTGFLVRLDQNKGIIFTNTHVVESALLEARDVGIEFFDGVERSEVINAKVVFESSVLDFAVIEFNPKELKASTRRRLKPVKIPNAKTLASISKRGQQVVSLGFPVDQSNGTVTFGHISGDQLTSDEGKVFLTDASMDIGNSGGPLIHLQTGYLLGINTSIQPPIGFTIPIDRVMREYKSWKDDASYSHPKKVLAFFGTERSMDLESGGVKEDIEKIVPQMFKDDPLILSVYDADVSSNLKKGDFILKVNGEILNSKTFRLSELIQQSNGFLDFLILRKRKKISVQVPVVNLRAQNLRQTSDFVYMGGALFQELNSYQAWLINPAESRVYISKIITQSPVHELSEIKAGSVLSEIHIDQQVFVIRTLKDLKKVLKKIRLNNEERPSVRVVVFPPIKSSQDEQSPVLDTAANLPMVSRRTTSFYLPVDQILTPGRLSIRKMKLGADFIGVAPSTHNWRNWIHECAWLLKPSAK